MQFKSEKFSTSSNKLRPKLLLPGVLSMFFWTLEYFRDTGCFQTLCFFRQVHWAPSIADGLLHSCELLCNPKVLLEYVYMYIYIYGMYICVYICAIPPPPTTQKKIPTFYRKTMACALENPFQATFPGKYIHFITILHS